MAIIFTPEVLFNIDYDTIFDDPNAEENKWEEPSAEQMIDEVSELRLKKKLHIRQVRRCGDFDDCSFICSKKDIKRDFILFFQDTRVYGDSKHSDKASYLYVLKHIGRTVLFNDMGIEMIKAHNRSLLKALHDICKYIIDNNDFDIEIKDVGVEYLDIAERVIDEVSNLSIIHTDFITDILYCLDALIYTEDDILII
jgi:hypothetical protein